MRTIFLADAHLNAPMEHNYRMLMRFFRELEGNTETLFIMGDLFDFWLGFPLNPFRQYDEVLVALQSLVDSGCRLVYFEGNHDFHMGPLFRNRLKAEIHGGPVVMSLQGRKLFLCHGDQINRADYGYRMLRALLHNPVTAAAIRVVPPALVMRIKELLQHNSRSGYQERSQRWDYPAVIRAFSGSIRDQGCDGLVTGHFHTALCENLPGAPFTILSLGDWMEQFTYGELESGTLSLKKFPTH